MMVDTYLNMFMFLLLFTTIRDQDVKKSISNVTIKFSQRNLLFNGYVIKFKFND